MQASKKETEYAKTENIGIYNLFILSNMFPYR